MSRKLYFLLVIAAALVVISCGDRDGKELASINPGFYEISFDLKFGGQLIIFKQQVRYKADGIFEATNFQNNVPVEELKGRYKIENNHLVSYDNQYRLIAQEGNWVKKNDSKVEIRNIKEKSYEYYFKYPDEQSREKYKGLGVSEGWKKYKRISD